MNSGDVPNLYAVEDLEAIATACKPDCARKRIPPTKLNIFAQYLIRVKANIHVVLCMRCSAILCYTIISYSILFFSILCYATHMLYI